MISPDIINDFSALQNQIWQTITVSVSEAIGQSISFSSPLTISTPTADLYAEITAPMVIVQFSFSNLPESQQAVLIPSDTAIALAELATGNKSDDVDESLIADLRPTMEAIVQGLCLATGNVLSETVAASGLTVRYQVFAMPPNLQSAIAVSRTQVAIAGDGVNGSAIWLADPQTVRYMLNLGEVEADDSSASPFPQVGTSETNSLAGIMEENGIDRLLDVPLEISVELGRVKMLVKEVIELGTGSIVEIEKAAGEPVDVMVNGRLVARGEVVVIEDNFGVRVTEILNPHDRLARLNEAA
jgi:flagellar motor switch protein FliN/FliY